MEICSCCGDQNIGCLPTWKSRRYEQLITDGTSWRQTAIQNAVVGILTDGGFKMVNLSSGILAENETAKCLTGSIICTFKEGGQLLDDWRIVLKRLYPSRQDLLDMIPQSQALTSAKLANDGMVSTDTCNTARKTRCLLCKAIRTVAIEQGFREESINVMENDCWNHLRNFWFGAVIKELSSHSDEVLKDNLSEIHPILRVTTNPSNIFRAIESFLEKLQITPRDRGQCITAICALTIPKHIIIK
jgi:hypothetical protein